MATRGIQHKELRLTLLYKIIYGLVELSLPDYIIPAPRATRGHTIKFVQPPMHTDSYKYSFFPNSVSHWNKLPSKIDDITDLNNLQIFLRSYL